MANLQKDSRQLSKYHNQDEDADRSSLGSIDATCKQDMKFIISGEHKDYFETKQLIQKYENKIE